MTYEIKDLHHKLVVNLTTDSTNTGNMYLRVYKNNNTTPQTKVYTYSNGKFVVYNSDFTVGDTITKMEIVQTGSTKPWQTQEGVTVLINGEETETTINSNGTFTKKFKEDGEYDIQAVYLGNSSNEYAVTEKKHFQVKQPPVIDGDPQNDGQYAISYLQAVTPKMEYADGTEIYFRLTKGGVPLAGKQVDVVYPNGTNGSAQTKSDGTFYMKNDTWAVGVWKIGALFYNPSTGKMITSKFRDIVVKKGTPHWVDNAEDGTNFYVGGKYKARLKYRGNPLTNTKINLYVNGKKTVKTTSSTGIIVYPFKSKGTYSIKLVYKGDEHFHGVEQTKKFTVVVS